MRSVSSQKAGDLPQGVKSAVELLLGHPIDADEEVSAVEAGVDHVRHSTAFLS